MAAERPSLDDLFLASRKGVVNQPLAERPSLDDLFMKTKTPAATIQKERTPILPVAEDIPGIAASGVHGLTFGLSDFGRKPVSNILSGTPGEMVERGAQLLKNPKESLKRFAISPANTVQDVMSADLATPHSEVGFPVLPQPKSVTGKILGLGAEIGTSSLSGKAGETALRAASPALRASAVRTAQNILKPTGRFAKRSESIAEAALEQGVLKSSAKGTKEAALSKVNNLMDEVDNIAQSVKDKTVTAEDAFRRMDALSKWYQKRGDSSSAARIQAIKNDIIQGEKLTEPVFGEVETGQFVMGPASKQVTPQKTIAEKVPNKGFHKPTPERTTIQNELRNVIENEADVLQDMSGNFKGGQIIRPEESQSGYRTSLPDFMKHPGTGNKPLNKKEFLDLAKNNLESGTSAIGGNEDFSELNTALNSLNIKTPNAPSWKFAESETKNRIITPKKYLENPDDIVALNIPETPTKPQKIVSFTPKEKYSLRGETFGPSKKEIVKIGEKPREMSIETALEKRRGQDTLLKTKKVGGGYYSDTSSPEVLGRQEFAGALRKAITKEVPEIGEKNRVISKLIDVANVAKGRESVSSRNDLFGLVDNVMTAGGVLNPKIWALLAAKKLYQGGKAGLAKSSYALSKAGNSNNLKRLPRNAAIAQFGNRLLEYQS